MSEAQDLTTRFPSLYDLEVPEGAAGWEELYNWYHLRAPERQAQDEQRFWFQDRLHHPEATSAGRRRSRRLRCTR